MAKPTTRLQAPLTVAALARPACDPAIWPLAPDVTFLNHGSFGSCPRPVLAFQQQRREQMERQPVEFFVRQLEPLLDQARSVLAAFVGARPQNLVFVPNATAGVNTVLRSLQFKAGSEILVTNHEYNACRNALDFCAERSGWQVVVVDFPFPLESREQVIEAVLKGITKRTRLVLIDHVTSQTGLILPLESLVPELQRRGIDVLVDGAHAPGMLPLALEKLGAAYYTGNCHKWLCAPKTSAFLYVRPDRQSGIRPLIISHGANTPRKDRARFLIEFAWTGTQDVSASLSVPEALRFLGTLTPGGWPAVMARNRALALAGRALLQAALGLATSPCPDSMVGALAAVPLPPGKGTGPGPSRSPLYSDPLQDQLRQKYRIEVPVIPWPRAPHRLLRISAQLYNHLGQYEKLAEALGDLLPAPRPRIKKEA